MSPPGSAAVLVVNASVADSINVYLDFDPIEEENYFLCQDRKYINLD